jgi:hypothetical protein
VNVKTMTASIVLERHGADVIYFDLADPPKSLTNSQAQRFHRILHIYANICDASTGRRDRIVGSRSGGNFRCKPQNTLLQATCRP